MFGRSGAKDLGRCRKGSEVHTLRTIFGLGQKLPDLFAREAGDGREQSDQRLSNMPGCGLGRTAALRLGGRDVKTVFEYVEIERTQVHDAEMIYPVIDLVESELVVPLSDVRREGSCLTQHVLVERFHLVERNRVFLRVEIIK